MQINIYVVMGYESKGGYQNAVKNVFLVGWLPKEARNEVQSH